MGTNNHMKELRWMVPTIIILLSTESLTACTRQLTTKDNIFQMIHVDSNFSKEFYIMHVFLIGSQSDILHFIGEFFFPEINSIFRTGSNVVRK